MNKYHGDKYKFKYSTPSNYIDAIRQDKNIEWPVKYDDMFPYSDAADSYWTGFYSSRPNDKFMYRRLSSSYQNSNSVYAEKFLD